LLRSPAPFLILLAAIALPQSSLAQRAGEVTVAISQPPAISVALPRVLVAGEHRLHFRNTTSRDAKIRSMEILFIEQSERRNSCELFFGNVIGAAVRRYELKEVLVPSAKSAAATAKLLPADNDGVYVVEPSERAPAPRLIIIACYRFVFDLDDAELEVTQLAGRWVFDRKTGKLVSKNVTGKVELLPR
jgi:hypothetical protein